MQEVAIREETAVSQPETTFCTALLDVISRAARDPNVDVGKMERLLEIQERILNRKAEEEFRYAMSAFQRDCPIIEKSTSAMDYDKGRQLYKFAPLSQITAQTKELIAKYGFSYHVKSEFPQGAVKVIITVDHIGGHSKETAVEMPLMPGTARMNPPQIRAATLMFAKRYAFCDAFGIVTGDPDTDGPLDGGSKEAAQAVAVAKIVQMGGQLPDNEPLYPTTNDVKVTTSNKRKKRPTSEQIDFLGAFGEMKKALHDLTGSNVEYYAVLSSYGYEHANEITSKDRAREVYRGLGKVHSAYAREKEQTEALNL